ncbi:MAG: IS66 family transposase [Planctomycetota bacterium]|nr:IS66 family transposase [Planctomycetota bacterium]
MQFAFYPHHEHNCPNVGHCPHLGGASLGTLVLAAGANGQHIAMLQGQLLSERRSVATLVAENEQLRQQLEQCRLELKAERQRRFCKDRPQEKQPDPPPAVAPEGGKKPGAPQGHPGWFRPQPTVWDKVIEVSPPSQCPHCGGGVRPQPHRPPYDHIQEDVVDGRLQVVLYRHAAGRCQQCRNWVKQAGVGEILGSKIGPHARAMAAFLHNEIGVSASKVPQAIAGLSQLRFTSSALFGFETKLARNAKPLVRDIAGKIRSTNDALYADETYWSLDGKRAYFWIHATRRYVHFHFTPTRAGKVSRRILGDDFTGILVTDCYAGYDAQEAAAKQKCLAHLTRTARDWQKVVPQNSLAWTFFEEIKTWVTRGCRLHRMRSTMDDIGISTETVWLRSEQQRLENTAALDQDKARTLQKRMRRYSSEWLTFLDHPEVSPTNNHAEQILRPLVILRKITFGHRSQAGARRTARLMTVMETAKRHGHGSLDIFYRLSVDPPESVLRHLYSGP